MSSKMSKHKRKLIIELDEDDIGERTHPYTLHTDTYYGPLPEEDVPMYVETLLQEVIQLAKSDAKINAEIQSLLNKALTTIELIDGIDND